MLEKITDLIIRIYEYYLKRREYHYWYNLKPYLVFWYITFNGDQKRIYQAYEEHWGIRNRNNFNKVMKGVNLEDYLVFVEKGFYDYEDTDQSYIIKITN